MLSIIAKYLLLVASVVLWLHNSRRTRVPKQTAFMDEPDKCVIPTPLPIKPHSLPTAIYTEPGPNNSIQETRCHQFSDEEHLSLPEDPFRHYRLKHMTPRGGGWALLFHCATLCAHHHCSARLAEVLCQSQKIFSCSFCSLQVTSPIMKPAVSTAHCRAVIVH